MCLLLLCLAVTARAQYRFDHWTADNGLPQNSVRDMVQTRDGYLWLTTFDGLVRFDGVRFTVFNKSNSPGIITNRFVWLYEDAPGDLWASTEDGALTRLHQGRFTTYTKGQGLPGERVNKIGDDGQGNLIVLFFSPTQVYRWWQGRFEPAAELRLPPNATAPERNQARRMPLGEGLGKIFLFIDGQLRSFNTRQTLFDNSILAQDQQGQIWFSNVDGLFKVEQGGLVLVRRWGKGCPARNRD